jgi:dolichol-phosphate mannosyltransferase
MATTVAVIAAIVAVFARIGERLRIGLVLTSPVNLPKVTGAFELAYRIGAAARHPSNWLQLFKFGLVGGSGYLINLAVFALLSGVLDFHHLVAAVAAFAVAVTNNFLLNRHWTFAAGAGAASFQAPRFFAVSLASLGLNLVVLEILVSSGSVGELSAQAIAVAVAMPFNFIGNRLWTFA